MLRLLLTLFVISSCSTVKTGGQDSYSYDHQKDYTPEELSQMSSSVVVTLSRDPHEAKLSELFGKGQAPLKRVGIVIFESTLQPTRAGLATEDRVFLSEAGKQILTEKLLHVWDQAFPVLAPSVDYVSSESISRSKSLHNFGLDVVDHVKTGREDLGPDDIYFAPKGQKTPIQTVLNSRKMQDMSFLLVPAHELMGGPKWSEHNKHFLNEVVKELKLDAALIVMSEVSWTRARIEKNSGESIPEEMTVTLTSSVLVPFSSYEKRLKQLKKKETPSVNLCYRTYKGELKIPVRLDMDAKEENLETINREILLPSLKTYTDLTQMMIQNISRDLVSTQK